MEKLDGGDLLSYLEKQPGRCVDEVTAATFFAQMTTGEISLKNTQQIMPSKMFVKCSNKSFFTWFPKQILARAARRNISF